MMSKKILLAEDHAIVIKGVKIIFATEFPGYTLDVVKNSVDLIRMLKNNVYSMAIIDLQLEDGDTFHMVTEILSIYPNLSVLIFTANPEELYAHKLYKAGVKGYLSKTTDDEEIAKAIRHTLGGNVYMSEAFKTLLVTNTENRGKFNPLAKLTERELAVAILLRMGKRNTEICAELNMHANTVSTFKTKIFAKLNVENIVDLNLLFQNYDPGNL